MDDEVGESTEEDDVLGVWYRQVRDREIWIRLTGEAADVETR